MKICRDDEIRDFDKVNLYCYVFTKYIKCLKEIELPFLLSVLKNIESAVDIITNHFILYIYICVCV